MSMLNTFLNGRPYLIVKIELTELELTLTDRLPVTPHYCSIVTMDLSCSVFKVKGDNHKFSHSSVFNTLRRRFPLEICKGSGNQEN